MSDLAVILTAILAVLFIPACVFFYGLGGRNEARKQLTRMVEIEKRLNLTTERWEPR